MRGAAGRCRAKQRNSRLNSIPGGSTPGYSARTRFHRYAHMSDPQFQKALPLADIPQGQMRPVTLNGREIVICHTKEGVYALDNICSHAHARMCEGRLRATRIVCPLHGASFDIRDGKVLGPPATQPQPTFPVRVVDGTVEIAV